MLSSTHLPLGNGHYHLLPHVGSRKMFLQTPNLQEYPSNFIPNHGNISMSSNSTSSESYSLSGFGPLEAILFDVDGTLCDSDPLHYHSFREMLQEVGFNNGIPISEKFFIENISGMHNEELSEVLFPNWDFEKRQKFMDDKEVMFRRLAKEQLKPVKGLKKLCRWIEDLGLKRGAVTNAPRANAEHMISMLGLSDFFQTLVIASECVRAKPFPDPYLDGLQSLDASAKHTVVFEDSPSGTKAGVAAGMPVFGITTRNPENLLIQAGATFLIKDFDDPRLWTELEALRKGTATKTLG